MNTILLRCIFKRVYSKKKKIVITYMSRCVKLFFMHVIKNIIRSIHKNIYFFQVTILNIT